MTTFYETDCVIDVQSPDDEIVATIFVELRYKTIDRGYGQEPDHSMEIVNWKLEYAISRSDEDAELYAEDLPWLTDDYIKTKF